MSQASVQSVHKFPSIPMISVDSPPFQNSSGIIVRNIYLMKLILLYL